MREPELGIFIARGVLSEQKRVVGFFLVIESSDDHGLFVLELENLTQFIYTRMLYKKVALVLHRNRTDQGDMTDSVSSLNGLAFKICPR